MAPDKRRIQQYLKAFDFRTLFIEELGWDTLRETPLAISVDGQSYTLHSLVEKRGFKVYTCGPDVNGQVPGSAACPGDRVAKKVSGRERPGHRPCLPSTKRRA